MMKIAYVGYQVQEKYNQGLTNDEDADLLAFLQQKGLSIEAVVWNDEKINWQNYHCIVLKSPWDYHENISRFYTWLAKIKSLGIQMLNPVDTIIWNSHKRYLADIARVGLPVISSVFLDKGTQLPTQNSLFNQLNTHKIVIKPCVSAGAKNTFILHKQNIAQQAQTINTFLQEEEYIAQPFVEEIANGEWSFLFFNGQYSHAVLKVPKQGDFRVQHYHGGSIQYPNASQKLIAQAEKYVQQFAQKTLYARVDGVLKNDTLHLMELELIEPYLFLNTNLERQEIYYQAFMDLI